MKAKDASANRLDVYFAEVALLAFICANTHALFDVGRGDAFHCHLDRERFAELAALLTN